MKILIDSVYLNSFGGKELLNLIVSDLKGKSKEIDFFYLLDKRNKSIADNLNYEFCSPNIRDRKKFYKKNLNHFDKIICLANVPPPVSIKNKTVIILFHNALLLEWTNSISLFSNIKNFIKNKYIHFSILKNYTWVVQTELMKKKLIKSYDISMNNIRIYPLFRTINHEYKKKKSKNSINILCVSSESPHKMNNNLLKAFTEAKYALKYEVILSLTINKKNIKPLKENKKVVFLGNLTKDEINYQYSISDFLIFPSVIESFGLPLVEATFFKLKIIASNSEYVNYVVKPSLTFNPNSVDSIKKTIEKVVNLNSIEDSELIVNNKLDSFINFICSNV